MDLKKEGYNAVKELCRKAQVKKGDLLIVGCSTSEVSGQGIGSASKPELASDLFSGIYEAVKEENIYLAAQCCEHLNRALVVERALAEKRGYKPVSVIPWPKAGGPFGTMAYRFFDDPVVVEHITAQIGMDIGDTLIGMHLDEVAVPVRLSVDKIGMAHLVCARTRPKYIGGERAHYDQPFED